MVAHSLDISEALANSDYAQSAIGEQITDRDFWLKKSKAETLFRDELEEEPKTDSHLALMIGVTELLERSHVDKADALDLESFKNEFKDLIDTYLKDAFEWFRSKDIIDLASYSQHSNWRPKWRRRNNDNNDYMTPSHTTNFDQQHQDALAKLVTAMTNNQIPDDIILYLLVPSLTSAGFEWIDQRDDIYGMISYVLFMPYKWILHSRDQIWELRMKDKFEDEDKFYDPSVVDDNDLARFEEEELSDLTDINKAKYDPENDDIKGKGRQPMDEQTGTSSDGPTKSKKKKKQQKKDDDEQAPPPSPRTPTPPPTQPQIPNDDDYTPDPILTYKARDVIRLIQNMDDLPDTKDHLKRFGINHYFPQILPKRDIRGTDARYKDGFNFLGRLYVITFTRQHRKPIFNLVTNGH